MKYLEQEFYSRPYLSYFAQNNTIGYWLKTKDFWLRGMKHVKHRHRRTFLMRHARRFVDEGENVTIYYKKECRVLKSFKHRTKLECGRRGYIYKEPDANNQ